MSKIFIILWVQAIWLYYIELFALVLYNTGEEAKSMTGGGGGGREGGLETEWAGRNFSDIFLVHTYFFDIFWNDRRLCKVVFVLRFVIAVVALSRRRDSSRDNVDGAWSIGSEKRRGGRERRSTIICNGEWFVLERMRCRQTAAFAAYNRKS